MPKKPVKSTSKPRRYTPAQVDSINAAGQKKMMNDRMRRYYINTLGEKEYKRRLT